MVAQSRFLLPSPKLLRKILYPWRKDAAQAGGADLEDIVATHRSQAECPEAVMLTATTVAHLALGVAHGVTAATRLSTEGIRTGRGTRAEEGLRAALLVVRAVMAVTAHCEALCLVFGQRGWAARSFQNVLSSTAT
jgi:hypothetical protein